MSRNLLFLILATALIVIVLAIVIRYSLRLKASSKTEWKSLLETLTAIDRTEIDLVALDAIEPSGRRDGPIDLPGSLNPVRFGRD
jgi:hypothetical protein